MNDFAAAEFLGTDIEGASSTDYVPIPEGDYNSQIEKVDYKEIAWENENGSGVMKLLEALHKLDLTTHDQGTAVDVMGDEVGFCRQSISLDFKEDGTLDMRKGKNVALGRLREAVGQNNPDQRWNPNMLIGQTVKANVKHRVNKKTGEPLAEVKGVAAL